MLLRLIPQTTHSRSQLWRLDRLRLENLRFRCMDMAYCVVIIILALISSACNSSNPTAQITQTEGTPTQPPVTPTEQIPSPIHAPTATATLEPTIEDTPTLTPTPTPSPTFPPNNVSGEICFPGGDVPEMTLYLEETNNETMVELPIERGQTTYEADLSPGTYIAYAWLKDFSRGGLYSRAVPCGLDAECQDQSYLPFTVTREMVTEGVDVCDWYAGPFNVPYPPGIERTELTGSITGNITYLDSEEDIPRLRVVAFNRETEYWYWLYTQPGQTTYTLSELPPGTYHLVAYDSQGNSGGYANSDYNLIDVVVESGETTGEINISTWNAPREAFPPDPTRE